MIKSLLVQITVSLKQIATRGLEHSFENDSGKDISAL